MINNSTFEYQLILEKSNSGALRSLTYCVAII